MVLRAMDAERADLPRGCGRVMTPSGMPSCIRSIWISTGASAGVSARAAFSTAIAGPAGVANRLLIGT